MTIKVTTQSGSEYIIDQDGQFWRKNDGPTQRLWAMKTLPAEFEGTPVYELWSALAEREYNPSPKPGEFLYIASRDEWYVTTAIASVEECEW